MHRLSHNTIILAILISLTVSLGTTAEAQDSISQATLQKMYVDYLVEEGYKPAIDADGDIVFKSESMTYFIAVRQDDPEYFSIMLPNFWEIESQQEHLQVLIAADSANATSKVAKIYTLKNNTWAAVEIFVGKPEDFKVIFPRSLKAIKEVVENFVVKMRELRETDNEE